MRSSPSLHNLWRHWQGFLGKSPTHCELDQTQCLIPQCCPSLGLFEFIDVLLILNFIDSMRTRIFLAGSSKLLASNLSDQLSLSQTIAELMSFRGTKVFRATDPFVPSSLRSKTRIKSRWSKTNSFYEQRSYYFAI